MSTEPVYCFEYEPTKIIARAIEHSALLQILQDGKEVARYRCHRNNPISFSEDGKAAFIDAYGRLQLLNFNNPFPQETTESYKGECISPNGRFIYKYALPAFPYEQEYTGLIRIALTDGAIETVWDGDTTNPSRIALFGEEQELADFDSWQRKRWKRVTEALEYPELALSTHSNHWAMIGSKRLILGDGERLVCSLYWQGYTFYPEKFYLDWPRRQLILAGNPGLVAFDLDSGEIKASWRALLPCEPYEKYGEMIDLQKAPISSPPVIYQDKLLATIQVRERGEHRWFEIHQFDPDTLAHLGKWANSPTRRSADQESALLPLADGSLAWIMHHHPILILPASNSHWKSSEYIEIVGEKRPSRIPLPEADWYDEQIGKDGQLGKLHKSTVGQRRSLARYFLNELISDRQFGELLLFDKDAFLPYADQVCEWGDADLEQLRKVDYQHWWQIGRGAGDTAVTHLQQQIEKQLPKLDHSRLMLLLGVHTTAAYEALANLGRQSDKIMRLCADYHIEIRDSGPAVPRLQLDFQEIIGYPAPPKPEAAEEKVSLGSVLRRRRQESKNKNTEAHDDALFYPLPATQFVQPVHGVTCAQPLAHVLTISLTLLPPLAESPFPFHHWFLSNCELCDESVLGTYFYRPLEKGTMMVEIITAPELDGGSVSCVGMKEVKEPVRTHQLKVEPYKPKRKRKEKRLGRLGGYPEWWQQPEPPYCPECQRLMFYVGQAYADGIRADMVDAALFAFHCEDCGVGAQVLQIT